MDRPPWQDAWEAVLDWLTQIVTPSWNDLIPLIPTALAALAAATLVLVALRWRQNWELNQPRVPPRRRVPPTPPGVHLPGPSKWPFVLPVAAALVFGALAFRPRNERGEYTDPFSWPLLAIGLVIGLVGIVGWLRDAMREWRTTEAGGHAAAEEPAGFLTPGAEPHAEPAEPAAAPAAAPAAPEEPPPGVHLPGPSPWPFFAPVALAVIFLGLVYHPVLVIAGIAMGAVAAVGWLRDAGREYHALEGAHLPTNRDPRLAIPRRVVAAYAGILAVALLVIAMPSLIAFANPAAGGGEPSPSGPGGPGGGPGGPGGPITLVAEANQFDKQELSAPAETPFQIVLENRDQVPHNVAIYDTPERGQELFNGELLSQPGTITYDVPALAAGSYYFVCIVHANMEGTLTAQ